MKALHVVIIVAALFVAFARSSSAQGLFSPPRPTSGSQSYFVPPPSGPHSTKPRAEIKVPQPEGVSIDEHYAKGSVVIINHERAIYFVEDAGRATRYPVAIGSPVDQWEGVQTVTAKRENPKWFPTEDIQLEMGVPSVVMPGPHNPLGPRALYLGDTLYRIHGTNRPGSIGGAVSHGCFRMHNSHIIELYEKVQIGASVYVVP